MFKTTLFYLYIIVFLLSLVFVYSLANKRQIQKIEELTIQAQIEKVVMEVEVFENNQSIIIKTKKELKDEEVPSDIGFHHIDFD